MIATSFATGKSETLTIFVLADIQTYGGIHITLRVRSGTGQTKPRTLATATGLLERRPVSASVRAAKEDFAQPHRHCLCARHPRRLCATTAFAAVVWKSPIGGMCYRRFRGGVCAAHARAALPPFPLRCVRHP